jgi:hypothetical protein
MDTSYKQQDNPTPVSTFETIDMALYTWINEKLNIHATTNEGIKKVPIVWFSRERAFQIKEEKENRDNSGFLDFPQIQLQRASIALADANKRPIPGVFRYAYDYKDGQLGIWKKVQQDKTKNFANARAQRLYGDKNFKSQNPEVVNEYIFIPYPSYYEVKYEISLKSLYLQQLNEMMAPIQRTNPLNNSNVQTIKYGGFKYELFTPADTGFSSNSPDIAETEKIYESKISVTVLGFTTTNEASQTTPNIVHREGPAKIRIQRERIIVGDINMIGDPNTPYRE